MHRVDTVDGRYEETMGPMGNIGSEGLWMGIMGRLWGGILGYECELDSRVDD